MHVENITSNAMSLDRNGQSMLIQVYEKELDRLNNIIDELEKSLKAEYDYCDKHLDPAFGIGMSVAKRTLDKLKKLKENK